MTEMTFSIVDDLVHPANHPFRLQISAPLHFDRVPKHYGKWWTVSIYKAPSISMPVTFHFREHADAILLIARLRRILNDLGKVGSNRLPVLQG
jgi:hypothetical protein